jgi:HSP90 family molecular chaperone
LIKKQNPSRLLIIIIITIIIVVIIIIIIIKVTNRLSDSPAIVTDHESGALRRMLKMIDQSGNQKSNDLPPQNLEINPSHPIIISLYAAMKANPDNEVNKLIAEQLFDNALVAAGLIDDPRMMLNRLNEILVATLKK